jgi:CBS domain-containing protein
MKRRNVADLISGDVVQLPGSATALDAARLMVEHHIGAILVIEEGKLRGIFTERDALYRVMAQSREPGVTPLSGVMSGNLKTVAPDTRAVEALLMMRDGGFRHLPVVEAGQVVGIISLRDFVGAELQEVDDQLQFENKIAEG